MTSALDPARSSRRTFLATSVATLGIGAAGLTGCSPPGGPTSPQAQQRSTSVGTAPPRAGKAGGAPDPAQPSVSVFPGSVEGAILEAALAGHAATVLAVGHDDLGKAGRRLVSAIRDQHLAHAAALRTTDPTDPSSAPTKSPGASPSGPGKSTGKKPSFAKAVHRLMAAESKAAVTHRAAAVASRGLAALLWGSLAASASAIATILKDAQLAGDGADPTVATVAAVKDRAPMPVVRIVAAEQEMVRQLHAIIYGYQLALGRLTGTRRDTAAAELKLHRILRDRLTARLLDRKADVPVAAAAYVPSTNPRNPKSAAKLIRQMDTALVPFCGLWLAAAETPGQRTEAQDQLGRTARVARQWGASQPAWPGWQHA